MPGLGLRGGKIGDVAENAADRAPRDMNDGKVFPHGRTCLSGRL